MYVVYESDTPGIWFAKHAVVADEPVDVVDYFVDGTDTITTTGAITGSGRVKPGEDTPHAAQARAIENLEELSEAHSK